MSASASDRNAAPQAVTPDDALDAFCDRAKTLFQRQQERVQQLEADLSQHIETAIEEINLSHAYVEEREEQFAHFEQELTELARQRDQAFEARGEAESLLDEARVAISHVSEEQHDLRVQLSRCHKRLNARADELTELRARLREATGEPSSQLTEASHLTENLSQLEAERNALREELEETRQQLAAADGGLSAEAGELDALRERFETAVQEIRELKKRNKELNDQLSELRMSHSSQGGFSAGGFDWEAQKRRLMLQLESDFDETDSDQARDKLTVEGTIRITDQVIAEKDREISDLQTRLEAQSNSPAEVPQDAVAIAGLLDQDEMILEERERLKCQQKEWREKFRQAEIDISLERAKLGRERTALQGQLNSIDSQSQLDESTSDDEIAGRKSPRGRWRKRLGLKDD